MAKVTLCTIKHKVTNYNKVRTIIYDSSKAMIGGILQVHDNPNQIFQRIDIIEEEVFLENTEILEVKNDLHTE